MNLPELHNQELNSFFNRQDFVEATLTQIKKDLQGLFYGDISFVQLADQSILETFVQLLAPILKELSRRQPEQLSQFIYRVDLSEKKFLEAVSADVELNQLAFLIIEREAQKVYLRLRFS